MAKKKVKQIADQFGITIESANPRYTSDGEWQRVTWDVKLLCRGYFLFTGEYHLGYGIAFPNTTLSREFTHKNCAVAADGSLLDARFSDSPKADDVVHSIVMDASCADYDDFEDWARDLGYDDFEDWARDLGYDTDSRKAFSIYEQCKEQTATLLMVLDKIEIPFESLQEAYQDY